MQFYEDSGTGPLDKKTRHKIYKLALEQYSEYYESHTNSVIGICFFLNNVSKENFKLPLFASGYEINNWPELKLFKPRRKYSSDHWLPPKDRETRKVILQFCIEMTR